MPAYRYANGTTTVTEYFDNDGNFLGATYQNADGSGSHFDYASQTVERWGPAPSGFDAYFFGGGWAASGLGAGVSGGGYESSGSAGVGLGVGYELGFSTDPTTAQQEGDNTETQWGIDVTVDFDPFTIGIGINAGIYQPVLERHNDINHDYVQHQAPYLIEPNIPPVEAVAY